VYEQQASSKYGEDRDEDILKRMIGRAELGGEWTSSMSASWTAKTSTGDERHSALPPSGLRALYEVLQNHSWSVRVIQTTYVHSVASWL